MSTSQLGALPGSSGTQVKTFEPAPGALATPFGSTLMVGAFQWGPVDKVILHAGQQSYKAERGTAMREDPTPTNCEDFYTMAKGSGRLMTLRLTDGTERQSVLDLYARDIGLDRLRETTPPGIPTRALRVQGGYAGRRGGQGDLLVGHVADLAANFNGTAGTFDTETAMVTDQFKHGWVYLEGVTRGYRISANSTAGVLTIEVPSGDAGPAAAAGSFTIVLDALDAYGDRDGLGVAIEASQNNPSSEFALQVHDLRIPAEVDPRYSAVGLDSTLDSYVEARVNVDLTKRIQHWLTTTADPDSAIGDPSADDMRPANFTGMIQPGSYVRSSGQIALVAVASMLDGETCTIGDGRISVTFEFKVTAGHTVTAGNVEVDISGDTTAADVMATFVPVINGTALKIQATSGDTAGIIDLAGQAGAFANATITETVANAGFVVSGMSGGTGPTDSVDLYCWTYTRTGTGTAYVDPASVAFGANAYRRLVAVCTFTAATTFTVQWFDWNEDTLLGTGGGTQNLGTAVDEGSAQLPTFTLRAGATAAIATDVVKVYFQPLPQNLKLSSGKLYAHAHDQGDSTNDIRTAFNVKSNTQTRVTLPSSTDLSTDHRVAAPGAPIATSYTAENYTLAGSETFIYTINGGADVTLTQTLSGSTSAAALATELNTQEASAHADGAWVQFSATTDGYLQVQGLLDFGSGAVMRVRNGTLNSIVGLNDDTDYNGSEGSAIALSWGQELERGLDGVALLGNASEYSDAFDLGTSPINAIDRIDYGLVKVAMPGVSGGDETDQNAMIAYCDAKGYAPRCEIDPTDGPTEQAAASHVKDNLTASRNRAIAWPSYGYRRRKPFTGLDQTYPMTGAILGMEANMAARRGGYHIAASGVKASVGEVFNTLATVEPGEEAPEYNDALLNPVGIQTVQQQGSLIYPDGGRNSEDSYNGTVWKHKHESILHLMHFLRVAGQPYVWEDLSPETRAALVSSILPTFRSLYDTGWFIRSADQEFFDVVQIQAGDAENPAAVQVLGELRAVIDLTGIIGTGERVVFSLGTGGVTAG